MNIVTQLAEWNPEAREDGGGWVPEWEGFNSYSNVRRLLLIRFTFAFGCLPFCSPLTPLLLALGAGKIGYPGTRKPKRDFGAERTSCGNPTI